ncbi:MAG: hypothetical protein PVI56_12720 [Gammaproteobacteria bacterium]|jgi:4-amino-4-deoxy-L-arabinose transferase-like glycosyltransferase
MDKTAAARRLELFGWVLAIIACTFVVSLFNHGPVPSMEPRFAEAVREMTARGNWLVPIKNGVPYIEYPPLYFWLGCILHSIGLPLVVAIRLPGYLAFFLWLFWLARLQGLLFPTWPRFLLPLAGIGIPVVVYNFLVAQSDSLLTLGIVIAFTGYLRLPRHRPPQRFAWEMWLGICLATAAKGPVGMAITLPAMGLDRWIWGTGEDSGLRGWLARGLRAAWELQPIRGLALVLAVTVPWYIAAGLTEGWDYVYANLVYQNFSRFTTGFSHEHAWYFYFIDFWGDFFPLAFLAPIGLVAAFRARDVGARAMAIWFLWTFLFFTVSMSKQGKYIMPSAPAVAALAIFGVRYFWDDPVRARLTAAIKSWSAVFALAIAAVVLIVVPMRRESIGGVAGFRQIQHLVAKDPGRIVSYGWPRSMTLYELGYPMPFVRTPRELYARVADGRIKAGDYLLTDRDALDTALFNAQPLVPVPAPPRFEKIAEIDAEKPMVLYRVLPGAAALPPPPTAEPPELPWWAEFDTD